MLTTTNLPRVIRTVRRYGNGEITNNIGGLNVMISDVIGKTFNFSFRYVVLLNTTRLVGSKVDTSQIHFDRGYAEVIFVYQLQCAYANNYRQI